MKVKLILIWYLQSIITRKHNPFILPEVIRTHDKGKILKLVRQLKEDNVPLPLLIWIIANDSRKKLNIKSEKILQSLHEIDKHSKVLCREIPGQNLKELSLITKMKKLRELAIKLGKNARNASYRCILLKRSKKMMC